MAPVPIVLGLAAETAPLPRMEAQSSSVWQVMKPLRLLPQSVKMCGCVCTDVLMQPKPPLSLPHSQHDGSGWQGNRLGGIYCDSWVLLG
jgi:hypothetical protein